MSGSGSARLVGGVSLLGALTAATLLACESPADLESVQTIILEPQDTTFQFREDDLGFRYRIALLDGDGDTITDPRVIEWHSSHGLVAQVSTRGFVTPIAPGVTIITARSGGLAETATVQIE